MSVAKVIDFERIEYTYFVAQAIDDGTPKALSASTTVWVTIRNINDESPIFAEV